MALSYLEMRPVQVSGGNGRGRVDWILIGRDWLDWESWKFGTALLSTRGRNAGSRGGIVPLLSRRVDFLRGSYR